MNPQLFLNLTDIRDKLNHLTDKELFDRYSAEIVESCLIGKSELPNKLHNVGLQENFDDIYTEIKNKDDNLNAILIDAIKLFELKLIPTLRFFTLKNPTEVSSSFCHLGNDGSIIWLDPMRIPNLNPWVIYRMVINLHYLEINDLLISTHLSVMWNKVISHLMSKGIDSTSLLVRSLTEFPDMHHHITIGITSKIFKIVSNAGFTIEHNIVTDENRIIINTIITKDIQIKTSHSIEKCLLDELTEYILDMGQSMCKINGRILRVKNDHVGISNFDEIYYETTTLKETVKNDILDAIKLFGINFPITVKGYRMKRFSEDTDIAVSAHYNSKYNTVWVYDFEDMDKSIAYNLKFVCYWVIAVINHESKQYHKIDDITRKKFFEIIFIHLIEKDIKNICGIMILFKIKCDFTNNDVNIHKTLNTVLALYNYKLSYEIILMEDQTIQKMSLISNGDDNGLSISYILKSTQTERDDALMDFLKLMRQVRHNKLTIKTEF